MPPFEDLFTNKEVVKEFDLHKVITVLTSVSCPHR